MKLALTTARSLVVVLRPRCMPAAAGRRMLNEQHDYPQRIRCERAGAGVTATISLADGTKARSFVFAAKQ